MLFFFMNAIFAILHAINAILDAIFYLENRVNHKNRVERDFRDFRVFTQKTAYVKITPWRDWP